MNTGYFTAAPLIRVFFNSPGDTFDPERHTISFQFNQSSEEETRVDASDLVINNPSELLIMIPELAAGTYKLKVCTQYAKGQLLKEPRTVIFDKELTVQ